MERSVKLKIFFGCISLLMFLCLMIQLSASGDASEALLESEPVLAGEDKGKKIMYLTFDDGPSCNTEKVLDILDEYDAKATFFVTNEFPDYASLMKEEIKHGHAVGIHTYSHEYASIYANVQSYLDDIEKIQKVIQQQTGKPASFLRFPGGSSNTVSRQYCAGIMSELSERVTKMGYEYYDWNATNGDGDTGRDAASIIATAKQEINEQDVVMLLMHDGAGNSETVNALPEILSYCKEKGFEFRVVDDSTPQFHHHINN